MPRGGGGQAAKLTTRTPNPVEIDIYLETGVAPLPDIVEWDPKPGLIEQLFELAARGNQVLIRAGTGGRSVGIAIWTGDNRRPPQFLHSVEELDEWVQKMRAVHERHPMRE